MVVEVVVVVPMLQIIRWSQVTMFRIADTLFCNIQIYGRINTKTHNGYRVFPGGKVRPDRDADPSPYSSTEV